MLMDKSISLQAEIRNRTGSAAAVAVRKQGRIPASVYGHKKEPLSISLNAHDFVEALHHGHRLIDVAISGKKEKVLVKDLQYDHLGRNVIHVDLIRVDVTEMIVVNVPIELKGTAKGTHDGGIIEEHTDHLEIQCQAIHIPDVVIVSVKDLGVGESIHASDVKLPDGVSLVTPPDAIVATCRVLAAAKTTEEIEAEAPQAPEVIREKKVEEGEEQAES